MRYIVLISLFLLLQLSLSGQTGTVSEEQVKEFASRHANLYNQSESAILEILSQAELKTDIIEKISKPAEKKLTWERYRSIFMTNERIEAGVEFWATYEDVLLDVSNQTGVPAEIICGIIGVETFFGRIKGSYKVLDALYTLGFAYPRRGKFFKSELDEFLLLVREENLDINTTLGSYAGAMGYSQFMPSSYRAYAKSYEENGTRDLMNSPEDAIASVANYLKVHRWKKGQPIVSKVRPAEDAVTLGKVSLKPSKTIGQYVSLGYPPASPTNLPRDSKATVQKLDDEYWMGYQNFYVITRYNHSAFYALAVYQLAEAIKNKKEES